METRRFSSAGSRSAIYRSSISDQKMKPTFQKVRKKLLQDAVFQKKYGSLICGGILYESTLAPDQITDADRTRCEERLRTRERPLQLFRVGSNRKGSDSGHRGTNGLDSLGEHIPAKVIKKGEFCAPELLDVPHAREMLGRRFLWEDRRWDETLSWTQSILFVLVLGTCRAYKGQKDINSYLIDADEARRPAHQNCPSAVGNSHAT